jgi:type IV secretion system protein VirD4
LKKSKYVIAALLFIAGSAANIFFSTAIHFMLLTKTPTVKFYWLSVCMESMMSDPQHKQLFLMIEGILLLLCFFFVIFQDKSYKTDEMKITSEISIPVSAGEGQHGTARFLKKNEIKKTFGSFTISAHDDVIAGLLRKGDRLKKRAEKYKFTSDEEKEKSEETYTRRLNENNPAVKLYIWFLKRKWEADIWLYKFKESLKASNPPEPPEPNKTLEGEKRFAEIAREMFRKFKNYLSLYEKTDVSAPAKKKKKKTPKIVILLLTRLKSLIRRSKRTSSYIKGGAGIVIGMERKTKKSERVFCLDDDIHSLIIGATRCGKTRCLVIQTICALALAGESIITSDPKGELYLYTSEYLKALDYDVKVMDFQMPGKSDCYNPLQGIIDAVNADEIDLAQSLTWDLTGFLVEKSDKGEPIWQNGEMSIIAAAILCVVYDNKENPMLQNLTNVYWFIANMCKDIKCGKTTIKPIVEYVKDLPDSHPAKPLLGIADVAPSKTAGSFYTSALTTLRLFTAKDIYSITSESDFRLDDIGAKKQALFFILPDEKTTYYPVATLYVSQIYERLVNVAKKNGNRLEKRVNFVLDEFGNFSAISDFGAKLTVGGGYGIRFNLFIQGFNQLTEKYNENVAGIVKSNCAAWVYLSSNDPRTLEELEKRLGKYTTTSYSVGGSTQRNASSSSSHNVSLQARSLLDATEIGRLKRPYQLLITVNHPAMMYSPDLSKWQFNRMLGLGDKSHNKKFIAMGNAQREVKSVSNSEIHLWGIWNNWTQ